MNSDALVDYFERLSPATLDQLDRFYAQAAWFKDPFHEVEGIEAIGAILRHTFDRLPGARFRVTRQFSASDGDLMLLWELDFVMPITSAPTTSGLRPSAKRLAPIAERPNSSTKPPMNSLMKLLVVWRIAGAVQNTASLAAGSSVRDQCGR